MRNSTFIALLMNLHTILVVSALVNNSSPRSQTQLQNEVSISNDRRFFLRQISQVAFVGSVSLSGLPTSAMAASASYLQDLESSYDILLKVPDLLRDQKWDEARTLLKTPPVNYLWNMGENQNTLTKAAKETGNFDLIELKDELSLSIQMCDQLTYDNVFVYFQPGNGKVKTKEPVDLAVKAGKQLAEAIEMVKAEQ